MELCWRRAGFGAGGQGSEQERWLAVVVVVADADNAAAAPPPSSARPVLVLLPSSSSLPRALSRFRRRRGGPEHAMASPAFSDLLGLNPRPGAGVQAVIKAKFGSSVSPVSRGKAFLLVASFGHCKFKLTPASVGAILQATLGGVAADFDVFPLADRVFRFAVSSSLVGFHIIKLLSFECSSYKLFFHLWSNGGPNWIREWRLFCAEEAASWTVVRKGNNLIKPSVSFVDAVKNSPLTGANRVPIKVRQAKRSVFDRLFFPSRSDVALERDITSAVQSRLTGTERKGTGWSNVARSEQPVIGPNQIPGSILGQGPAAKNPLGALPPGICFRCLRPGHPRSMCKSPIRCYACGRGGHIATNCLSSRHWKGKALAVNSNDGVEPISVLEPDSVSGPLPRSPADLRGFTTWAELQASTSKAAPPSRPINLQWLPKKLSLNGGASNLVAHPPETALCLGRSITVIGVPPSSFNSPASNERSSKAPKKPQSAGEPQTQAQAPVSSSLGAESVTMMAYQRVDPNPFKPWGTHILNIPNRPMMVRTIALRRPQLRNENLAIVTISPLPGNPLYFPAVEEVVREFCINRRVRISEVQPCPLGQAFVRFERDIDRDRLVLESPHSFDGVDFSFVRHNQARNWRRVYFNHECWLMLMGLPQDYWDQDFIETVLGPCAKVLDWGNDPGNLARMLVRARVTDLEALPHFSIFSDGIGHESNSWTVQIEILQNENLGLGPQEEEHVPAPPDDGPPLFDFFGLGQQVLAPVAQHDEEQANVLEQEQQQQWPAWPEVLPVQQIDLNLAQPEGLVDLNEAPVVDDPQEVIIHPTQFQQQEDALEIMPQPELQPEIQPAHQVVIPDVQIPVQVLIPAL